ncbi:MAG: mandelate racemase/muconate lactonizing enzyme family protein [Erysipelotrichaceae bacterium]|nr:mandelate racemase/muconate lactonizing enzyme family protein [Erysipelotrichaceae bacterium]
MKITNVSAMILRYQYENAIADAQNYFSVRNAVIVTVETDAGISGIGEAACFGGPAESTKFIVEKELGPIVIGEDPTNIERLWKKMFDRTRQHGRGGIIFSAMSGIDVALWDILGKHANCPVYKLLGGYSDRLLPYASSGFYTKGKEKEQMAAEVESYFKQGFKYAKIKVGRNPGVFLSPLENMQANDECTYTLEEDYERVKACTDVADRYGARIMVDANNTYNTYTAIKMGKAFQDLGVFWLEEPLHLDNIEGSIELAQALDMPVAGYESETGLFNFREYINRHAVDIVQPDTIWSGGITECVKIANYAYAHNMPCMPHVFSSAVSLMANAHFLASISNQGILEMDRNVYPLRDELLKEPLTLAEDGYVYLPQKPGLGIELDEKTVEKYRVG